MIGSEPWRRCWELGCDPLAPWPFLAAGAVAIALVTPLLARWVIRRRRALRTLARDGGMFGAFGAHGVHVGVAAGGVSFHAMVDREPAWARVGGIVQVIWTQGSRYALLLADDQTVALAKPRQS